MFKRISTAVLTLSMMGVATHANAATINFDLTTSGDIVDGDEEAATFDLLKSGVTISFTANDGELNATSASFGINATAGGDATALIDNGSGVDEVLTFSFDTPGTLDSIDFFSFGPSDEIKLASTGAGFSFDIMGGASNPSTNPFLVNQSVNAGDSITVEYVNGAVGLETISFTPIPEPATAGLVVLGSVLLMRRRLV